MTDSEKPVVIELHPNLTVRRNPGQIQNVKVIVDADGNLRVLPEVPENEATETHSSPNVKMEIGQDLVKTEQLSVCADQHIAGNQTGGENGITGVWIKTESTDSYFDSSCGEAAMHVYSSQCLNTNETYQSVKNRQSDVVNTQQSWNTGDTHHLIKDEPLDINDTKSELKIINTYHISENLFKEENDLAESNCIGERIYLPYNVSTFNTDEETDSVPDSCEPIISEDDSCLPCNISSLNTGEETNSLPDSSQPIISEDESYLPCDISSLKTEKETNSLPDSCEPIISKDNSNVPFNLSSLNTGKETNSLQDSSNPIILDNESNIDKQKYAILTLADGSRIAFPICNLTVEESGNRDIHENLSRFDQMKPIIVSENLGVHPCMMKKNIWAPKYEEKEVEKTNCEKHEKEMILKRARKASMALNRRIQKIKSAILLKKYVLEENIKKEVDLEVAAAIKEKHFLKREEEKRKRLGSHKSQCCHICKKYINGNELYLDCELCSVWFHGSCVGITDKQKLIDMEAFLCVDCKQQQDSTYQQLHCICKTPLDDGKFYVGCDQCQGWFHGTCVGVSEKMADKMDTYTCPLCLPKKKAKIKKHLLTDTDYEKLWDLVRNLQNHKMAKTLNVAHATGGSDSGIVETQTVDLTLVEQRLVLKHYEVLSDFVHDMTGIFNTCRVNNPNNSAVYQCAEILESFFVQNLKSLKIK